MTDTEVAARFEAACEVVREAGQMALEYFRHLDRLEIEHKGLQDRVSEADREVEAFVRNRLAERFPEDGFLGEESGRNERLESASMIWVVDPIDGTDCFVNGVPVWCVSIAMVKGDDIEIGVIYDPNAEELFATRRGHGARLNGRTLAPCDVGALSDGILGLGFSHRVAPPHTLRVLEKLLAAGGMFQRNGSGALMLAYVAAGRYIGYYEAHINSWDALAGVALIREAGGWTNDFLADDGLLNGSEVIACGPPLREALLAICA